MTVDLNYGALLADMRAKRELLDVAIDAMAKLVGEAPPAPVVAPTPRRLSAPSKRPKQEEAAAPARPTNALSEAAVKAAIRGGAVTPKMIQAHTKLPLNKVKSLLAVMKTSGDVTSTGRRRAVRYAVA